VSQNSANIILNHSLFSLVHERNWHNFIL